MGHEGGYSIRAVANNQTSLNEQFYFEKELGKVRESFKSVHKLSPTTDLCLVFDADTPIRVRTR